MISNFNRIVKRIRSRVDNCVFLVQNTFHYIQTALNATLSKYDSKERFKSKYYPSSGYRILTQKYFNREKVHITENNLSFQAREKIHFIESDNPNRTRNGKIERTLSLEVNKTEIWSVNSE